MITIMQIIPIMNDNIIAKKHVQNITIHLYLTFLSSELNGTVVGAFVDIVLVIFVDIAFITFVGTVLIVL